MKTRGTKPPAGKKQGAAKRKRQSLAGLMPLEPRVMYDAAGAHTAASHMVLDPHHNDITHVTDTSHTSQAGAPTHASDASTSSTPAPAVTSPSPPPPPATSSPSGGSVVSPSGQVTNTAPTIVAGNTISYTGNSIPQLLDPNVNRYDEALTSFGRSLALQPEAETYFSRGTMLFNLSRFEEAVEDFERALAIEPEYLYAFGVAAFASRKICDWRRGEEFATALKPALVDHKKIIYPFIMLGYFDDPALQLQCARTYVKHKTQDLPTAIEKPKAWHHEKIRIAYVSADFH